MYRRLGFRLGALTAVLAVLLLTKPASPADDDAPTIEPREAWGNVFGGQKVEFHFTVKAAKAWKGRAVWSLAAENDRTLDSGESVVAADPDKAGEVLVKLQAPEVKPGVVLKTRLRVRLVPGADDKNALATHERTVWVFADDPFVNRHEWLKGLKINLFDPEKTTADPLKKLEVPFEEVATVAAMADIKEGVLLIGAGVSFKDYLDLPPALADAATRGLQVLCLAPSGGFMPAPGAAGDKGPKPGAVSWRGQDYIATLDARLDAKAWPPNTKVVVSTLALKVEDGAVVAEVGRGDDDWPWLEAEYPTKKGRLVVCGFDLFGKAWDAGPTPRYLFARLLEIMTEKTDDQTPKEKEPK